MKGVLGFLSALCFLNVHLSASLGARFIYGELPDKGLEGSPLILGNKGGCVDEKFGGRCGVEENDVEDVLAETANR